VFKPHFERRNGQEKRGRTLRVAPETVSKWLRDPQSQLDFPSVLHRLNKEPPRLKGELLKAKPALPDAGRELVNSSEELTNSRADCSILRKN